MSANRRAGPRSRTGRRGLALALVVALLLALTLLAHGALHLARSEGLVARLANRAALDAVERRSVLRRVFAGAAVDSLRGPPGHVDTLPPPAPGWTAYLTRETRETGVVTVEGLRDVDTGTPVRRRGHALLWSLEPVARVEGLRAAAAVGGESRAPAGTIDASGMYSVRADERPFCAALEPSLDSLAGRRLPPPAVAPLVSGPPFEVASHPAVALGALPLDSIERRLPRRVGGAVTPRPSTRGAVCDTADPDNWGSPTDPTGPCGAHTVAAVARSSLVLEGGVARGLLVVRGDLVLRDGALFAGLILTEGSLRLAGGARVLGAAVVGGDLELSSDSRVDGSGCLVASVLSPWSDLRRAVRIQEPSISLF